jgi:hypothetical protein
MMTSARSTVQSFTAADAGGAGIGGDWFRPDAGSFKRVHDPVRTVAG